MSFYVTKQGTVVPLDGGAEPDENLTEEDAQDPSKLAKMLIRVLREIATLKRRWFPRRAYFRDRTFDDTGTTKYRFTHNFGGRVEWWPASTAFLGAGPFLDKHSSSDNNTLVLTSLGVGTCTIVIEEAG